MAFILSKLERILQICRSKTKIIGEAAYRLTDEFTDAHPEVPWKIIKGMRHYLVHEYYQISKEGFLIIKTVSHGTDNRQINFRIYVHNLLERMAQENEADLEDKMQDVAKCRRVSHLESQMRRYR